MTKLNSEQLQQIESKLHTDYDFYYDDSKHEIIDHIASEIEDDTQFHDFEESFNHVFEKWKNKLRETNWIGTPFYGEIKIPVFYKKQLNKSFRNDFLMMFLMLFAFPMFLYLFKDSMDIKTMNQLLLGYKIFVFSTAIFLNIYTLISYDKNPFTTVYGQIATYRNKLTLIALVSGLYIFIDKSALLKYRDDFYFVWLMLILFNTFYFPFIVKYCNYFRHLKTVNRIKKMQFNY